MATVVVEPLGRATFFNKPVRQNASLASIPTPRARENKRPRSPDHGDGSSAKRVRPAQASKATSEKPKAKSQGNSKGESKDEEWKRKYLAYFPTTVFYFDTDHIDNSSLGVMKKRIKSLNGDIDEFFSKKVTHLITDLAPPASYTRDSGARAESSQAQKAGDTAFNWGTASLLDKAMHWGLRIWNMEKLNSVTARCLSGTKRSATLATPSRLLPLTQGEKGKNLLRRMLDAEKVLGTSERDPNQRRHDWNYFREGSRFVLIEDIHGDLATLGCHEYTPPPPSKEGVTPAKVPWPDLHLCEWSRNPFARPEEKDKKRWERLQQAKKEPDYQDEEEQKKKERVAALALLRSKGPRQSNKGGIDLRRTVSMSNMRRHNPQVAQPPVNPEATGTGVDTEDNPENLRASGFLPSGSMNHVAASGNSVSITSTTCTTTSVAGHLLRKAPSMLKEHRLVTTSLKHGRVQSFDVETKSVAMGPPTTVPQRQPMLKKSKSTNTLKLPKRDEGSKPGYCECCRLKFEDFNEHSESRKHRKFAANPANFSSIDQLLDKLTRRTTQAVLRQRGRKLFRNPFNRPSR